MNFPIPIRQRNPMITLFTHHLPEPILHPAIMNRKEHVRRSKMHFNCSFHHWEVYMVITHYLIRTHLIYILHHSFPATSEIDVYIPRRSHIRVRIKQRIPLPLQDAVSKALVLEVLANLHGILKQSDILLPNHFRHHHPLHQQLLLWCQLLWQSPDTIKQHPQQSLHLGDTI